MGKRFAILISTVALGAALMAGGASADFRSVHDPRGDAGHGPHASDSTWHSADIVGATAGHDGTRLKHTIRVVGKFKQARLEINTNLDPGREFELDIRRGRGRFGAVYSVRGARTGPARYRFYHHSVEIFFSEKSIGNPRGYGWRIQTFLGNRSDLSSVHDAAPNDRPHHRNHYIRHRLAQPAAALASHTVKIDSRVTLPPQERRPFYGRVKSSKHACEVHRLVKVFEPRPGRDHIVNKDRTNQRGNWWAAEYVLPEGRYYAKVLRHEEGTVGTTFVCRGDRSQTRHVEHQG